MRRFLLYQTIFFIVISAMGVGLSLLLLKDTSGRLQEIKTALISMSQRANLYREVETLDRKGMDYLRIYEMVKDCNQCHGTREHRQTIMEIETILTDLKNAIDSDLPLEGPLDRLHQITREAALKGESHLLEEASEVSLTIKRWFVLLIVSFILLFAGLLVISIVMHKRANRYIEEIIKATEEIAQGKNPSTAVFRDEFRIVGDALRRMQVQIKASEEKLQNWAEAWQKTFDTIQEMIAVCDSRGVIIQANRAFKRTFGRGSEGKLLNSLLQKSLNSDLSQEVAKVLTMAKSSFGEMNTENGFYRWTIYPVTGLKGDVTGFVWICRDSTRERELEQRALQAEKLVSLGELVGGIAHELNNPLSVVLGYSEMLSTQDLPEDVRQKVRRIFESAERASAIVRSLLDISKKKPVTVEPVKIEPTIKTILELMDYEFRSSGITVETHFEDTPVIEVDPVHIKQVAINLLKNAYDALSEKTADRKIWIKTFTQDNHLCIQVKDNGPGVPENIRHRIFDPFFTTKDVGKGTGLGLYSVFNLVKLYNGEIDVENAPEGGAVFTVRLPLKGPEYRA